MLLGGVLLASLIVLNQAAQNCLLLESRPGKCIYILRNVKANACLLDYAGFEYVPKSVTDLKELRKLFFWRNIKDPEFATGLKFQGNQEKLFFDAPTDANVWEKYSGETRVDPIAINFKKDISAESKNVVLVLNGEKVSSYSPKDTANIPVLCEASTHPELQCPSNYVPFRPSRRCFRVHPEHKTPVEAEKLCRAENAILSSINSVEEDMFLRKLTDNFLFLGFRFAWKKVKDDYPNKSTRPKKGDQLEPEFWDFLKKYMYNMDGFPVTYEHFEKGQPDFNTANEYYIVRQDGYKWHDFPASQTYGFLCATLPDQSINTLKQ